MTIAVLAVGISAGYYIRKLIAEARITSAEAAAKKIIEEAAQEANALKREKYLEAKEAHRLRNELERKAGKAH